jgi:hypothetical protein
MKERLLAEVEKIQGKIEANWEEMSSKQEEMKTKIGSLISQMDFCLVKTETNQEKMEAAIKAGQEEMKAAIRSSQERVEAEMNAWLEATKACLGKTEIRLETGQEPREAEIKTDLKEMKATE